VDLKRIDIKLIEKYMPQFRKGKPQDDSSREKEAE
jgi:hypothetical protein